MQQNFSWKQSLALFCIIAFLVLGYIVFKSKQESNTQDMAFSSAILARFTTLTDEERSKLPQELSQTLDSLNKIILAQTL